MRLYLLLIAFLFATGCDSTNPTLTTPPTEQPTKTFELVFGTENYDEGRALIQAANGDLLVAGAGNGVIAPADGTLPTPSLSRIAPNGDVRWTRIFDEQRYGTAVALAETSSEQFVLLADRHDNYFDDHHLTLWRLNGMQLSPLFDRARGNIAYESTRPLIVTEDSGFLVIGSERTDNGPDPVFIVRLDASGNQRWEHRIQGTPISLYAALAMGDGGFLVMGQERTSDTSRNILLLRFDSGGTLLWQQRIEGSSLRVNSVAQTSDGSFLLVGTNHEASSPNVYVLKVDARGHPLLEKTHLLPGTGSWADTRALISTSDGHFLATGSFSTAQSESAAFVLKMSETGDLEWLRQFDEQDTYTRGYDVAVLTDGNYAITGSRGPNTPTFGGANFDNLVLVLDADGQLTDQ